MTAADLWLLVALVLAAGVVALALALVGRR